MTTARWHKAVGLAVLLVALGAQGAAAAAVLSSHACCSGMAPAATAGEAAAPCQWITPATCCDEVTAPATAPTLAPAPPLSCAAPELSPPPLRERVAPVAAVRDAERLALASVVLRL
jgi:hypothetical protein